MERLINFVVGMTTTHPDIFPRLPDTASVMPYLQVCYHYQGQQDLVYLINCTQPVWGRFLVITVEGHLQMAVAEVIVNLECKYTWFVLRSMSFRMELMGRLVHWYPDI